MVKNTKHLLLAMCMSAFYNAQVGINTTNPKKTLDVEGTMRISETQTANIPTALTSSTTSNPVQLYVNKADGTVLYAPNGFTKIAGGFRPGSNTLITTLPVTNTIARVRFTIHVDNSNDTNNSNLMAYTYGDFTIIGTNNADPVHFIDVQLKGPDGSAKTGVTTTGTNITWNNAATSSSLGTTNITLNQTTGELRVTNISAAGGIFSYFFEILGGT